MTYQTSWLGSTGECGVPQNQVSGHFAQRRANVPLLVIWAKQRKVLPPDDAKKRAFKQNVLLILYCLHCAMLTDTLLPRRLWDEPWDEPPIGLNTKCVST